MNFWVGMSVVLVFHRSHTNIVQKNQKCFVWNINYFSVRIVVSFNTIVFFTAKQNSSITVVTILFGMKINGLLILIYYTSLLQYFIICHSFANQFRGPHTTLTIDNGITDVNLIIVTEKISRNPRSLIDHRLLYYFYNENETDGFLTKR